MVKDGALTESTRQQDAAAWKQGVGEVECKCLGDLREVTELKHSQAYR
jgi:hypothetical protein